MRFFLTGALIFLQNVYILETADERRMNMLLQFNFKNYLSFRDDTTLDFTATNITEHPAHVVTIGKEKVLPLAAIYGANASGKSNVLEAFHYMTNSPYIPLQGSAPISSGTALEETLITKRNLPISSVFWVSNMEISLPSSPNSA